MTRTALYRHYDAADRLLYVGITDRLSARDKQHAASAHWHDEVVRTETQWLADREAALMAEWEAIRDEAPVHNVRRCEPVKAGEEQPVPSWAQPSRHGKRAELVAYLKENEVTQKEFAALVGVTQGALSKLCNGFTQPSFGVALNIELATKGRVAVEGWPAFAGLANRAKTAPSRYGFAELPVGE